MLLASIVACGDRQQAPREPARSMRGDIVDTMFRADTFAAGGRVQRVIDCDLDGDGESEKIVVVLSHTDGAPSQALGNRVVVVARSRESGLWVSAVVDSSRWTTSLALRDVTGDHLHDIVMDRNSGGNDPIASLGMGVISAHGGNIRTVLSLRHGAPVFIDSSQGRGVVGVMGKLWPPMTARSESVDYLDDVLAFRDGLFRTARATNQARFARLTKESLRSYRAMRPSFVGDTARFSDSAREVAGEPEPTSPLFTPAALVFLYARRCGDISMAEIFWNREKLFLRSRMPPEQWNVLDSFSMRLMAGDNVPWEELQ